MVSPTLQGAPPNGFGEAVVACDMLELRKFPSLDSYQKRLLWTHTEVDLALHPVVGLVLQVGDAEMFPEAVSQQGPGFTAIEDGGDERLVQLELPSKTDGVAPPDPV